VIWGLCGLAFAAGLQFDRVDVLSGSSATFLVDDLPRISMDPAATTLRFVSQVAPVIASHNLELSSSLSVQYAGLRAPVLPAAGLWVDGGLVARGLLPVGARAGLALRWGPVHVGLGVCAEAGARWTNPRWESWTVRPSVGLGVGRKLRQRAPWME
jgi:hypothetical protein